MRRLIPSGRFIGLAGHTLCACALIVALPAAARAQASRPDTLGLHVEIGARTDWTTEQFYEDAFLDTTFLSRRLVDSPEARSAGVLSARLGGTRGGQRQSFQVGGDLSLGDRLSRGALRGMYRFHGDRWHWTSTPRAEYERDRTFGRDLDRLRLVSDWRLRRSLDDGANHLEAGALGEYLGTRGEGSEFLPDHRVVRSTLAFEHAPVTGAEWRAVWGLSWRTFPDSSTRDHVEQNWGAEVGRDFDSGHSWAAETHGARRTTRNPSPDSRDRFVEADVAIESTLRFGPTWAGGMRASVEGFRYDEPDTVVFFNYAVARAQMMPRYERASWTLAAGPRLELLGTDRASAEAYLEVSGVLEFEGTRPGTWWSFAPEFGWREYRAQQTGNGSAEGDEAFGARSSYRFLELSVHSDQAIADGIRVRLLGIGRYEAHTQSVDDSRSLYISIEVRKIF